MRKHGIVNCYDGCAFCDGGACMTPADLDAKIHEVLEQAREAEKPGGPLYWLGRLFGQSWGTSVGPM